MEKCKKVVYTSRRDAKTSAQESNYYNKKNDIEARLHAYKCPRCHKHHITRQKPSDYKALHRNEKLKVPVGGTSFRFNLLRRLLFKNHQIKTSRKQLRGFLFNYKDGEMGISDKIINALDNIVEFKEFVLIKSKEDC